jgi:NhaP-type Na+/H+ or K+/H+ antiporter
MTDLLILALLLFGYGLVSKKLVGSPVTPPMVFVTAGLLLGGGGLNLISGMADEEVIRVLAEATLVLVLFTDAVRIRLRVLRKEYNFPLRLLGIGMPAAIVLGALAAWLIFPSLGIWAAALLATVLVPTDAALGIAVVSDKSLPMRVRQTLNVESGLNDGIALPLVLLFVAVTAEQENNSAQEWTLFAARQIGLGVVAGVITGLVGGWLLTRMDRAGWITPTYRRLAVLALAVLTYAGAELVTGNGFIAAFVAGLCFGSVAREHCPHVHEFAEREGELLAMLTFTMFGAVIAGPLLTDVDWRVGIYAVFSLAVIRLLAVAVAMIGSKVTVETVLFFGWFGPRGLASILFALLVVEEIGTPDADLIMLVTSATVVLSVYAHGLTAAPWAKAFGRRAQKLRSSAPEWHPATEHHLPRAGFERKRRAESMDV